MKNIFLLSLLLSVLILNTSPSHASSDRKNAHAPTWGAAHLLTYEELTALSDVQIQKYIHTLRLFSVEVENRKASFQTASLDGTLENLLDLLSEQAYAGISAWPLSTRFKGRRRV